GQIKSSDSFSAYKKLVDDLHHEVIAIYENPSATEEEKRFFTNRIREMYAVYRGFNKKNPAPAPVTAGPKVTEADATPSDKTSVLGRQVEKYHALIERIVEKIEFLLVKFPTQIGEDRAFRLKELSTKLKQLKNTTNADRLKLIGEAALESIGKLEIELIEKGHIKDKKEVLGETNTLLRGMGSSKRAILPEDDFVVQMKGIWSSFRENYFAPAVQKKSEGSLKTDIGTNEFLYFKNVRELKAYEMKKSEINRELLQGIISLRGEKRNRLIMKKKLIDQNIELLSSRIKNRSVSYVKLKRGISQYSESFFYLCRSLGDFFTYSLLAYAIVYSVAYPVMEILSDSALAHQSVFLLATTSFVAFSLKQMRSWVSFSVFASTAATFVFALGVNF
ncbi:MAG: hypothetical protein QG650_538, partial [Patescibacteria group bacterium]|nr:hypothetical protein [Patescibacteria group bacterium]